MQHWRKFLMSYLHNGSTLEHNSNWFEKLQWRATTFVFFPFLEVGHVTDLPTTHCTNPDTPYCFSWNFGHTFLSDFLATMCELPYLEMCTDYIDTTSSLSTTVSTMSILVFLVFWLYLQQLPYWGMCTDHVNNALTLSRRVYIMSVLFLLIFSDFLITLALITALRNMHRPCKQYNNIIDNGLCHVTPFFLLYFLMFWVYLY